MYQYSAVFSGQRQSGVAPVVAMFAAPVEEVLKWSTVQRATTQPGSGHQRIKNESKVRAIRRFLELDDRNTIPTAVTLALTLPDLTDVPIGNCGELQIPDSDPPVGIVIDGQHRLFGLEAFNSKTSVNVIALLNADPDEVAFQFLVINNKATKVSSDHLKLLAIDYSEGKLADRLRSARMVLRRHTALVGVVDSSVDSPFYQSVDWPVEDAPDEERERLVRPAAIEQAFSVIAGKNLPDLANEDALIDFFFTLWSAVKARWPSLWNADSRLLSKVGVVTLTTFIIEDLVPLADRGQVQLDDPDDVFGEVDSVLASLTPAFWESEWTAKGLDTSAGKRMVVDALVQIRRNIRRDANWYEDVPLVQPTGDSTD